MERKRFMFFFFFFGVNIKPDAIVLHRSQWDYDNMALENRLTKIL